MRQYIQDDASANASVQLVDSSVAHASKVVTILHGTSWGNLMEQDQTTLWIIFISLGVLCCVMTALLCHQSFSKGEEEPQTQKLIPPGRPYSAARGSFGAPPETSITNQLLARASGKGGKGGFPDEQEVTSPFDARPPLMLPVAVEASEDTDGVPPAPPVSVQSPAPTDTADAAAGAPGAALDPVDQPGDAMTSTASSSEALRPTSSTASPSGRQRARTRGITRVLSIGGHDREDGDLFKGASDELRKRMTLRHITVNEDEINMPEGDADPNDSD